MKFIKDKILVLIILTVLLQIYILSTRGDWTTSVKQENSSKDEKNHLDLSSTLSIQSEHFASEDKQIIGSATYFETDKCFTVDSLSISIFQISNENEIELKRTKTRIEDLSEIEFDSLGRLKEESLLKSEKIQICPGRQRIGVTNWFEYPDKDGNKFVIKYFIRTTDNEKILAEANLTKKTNLEIHGRNHYDFIILLYPVLWIILGLLTLIKVYRVVTKK